MTDQSPKETLQRYGLEAKRPPVIDSSMLATYMACPMKFYLRYVLGLRPKYKNPKIDSALDWGTCWHEALFSYMSTPGDMKDRIEAGLTAIDEYYPSFIVPELDIKKRSKERMLFQFFAYIEKYKNDEKEYEILRHEQYFDVFFEDVNLRWCGRMDSLRRVRRNGKIRVWDYKTTGAMGPHYFEAFEISFQFPGYVAASDLLFTEEVAEITVDVMYTLSGKFEFFRRTFRYDEVRITEWKQNVSSIVRQIDARLDEFEWDIEGWNKNWGECQKYGQCMFFPTDSLNPRGNSRLLDLRDNYRVERWDPSAHAGDES